MGVNPINRIIQDIPIKIGILACKADRIFCGPSANIRIIITIAESHQSCIPVMHPAGKSTKSRTFDWSDLISSTCLPKIRNRRLSILSVCGWYDKMNLYMSDFIVPNFSSF